VTLRRQQAPFERVAVDFFERFGAANVALGVFELATPDDLRCLLLTILAETHVSILDEATWPHPYPALATKGTDQLIRSPRGLLSANIRRPAPPHTCDPTTGLSAFHVQEPAHRAPRVVLRGALGVHAEGRPRDQRCPLYAEAGVEWIWLVDPEARRIEVVRAHSGRVETVDTFEGSVQRPIRPFSSAVDTTRCCVDAPQP
jgi:hypothetical protein